MSKTLEEAVLTATLSQDFEEARRLLDNFNYRELEEFGQAVDILSASIESRLEDMES